MASHRTIRNSAQPERYMKRKRAPCLVLVFRISAHHFGLCIGLCKFLRSESVEATFIVGSFVLVLFLTFAPGILSTYQASAVNGWAMTIYYTISRTQTVGGLSPIMFVMTTLGNLTYIAQILFVSLDPEFLLDKIPVGSDENRHCVRRRRRSSGNIEA
eukprot:jgi/Bigna1/130910/aug1.12_g5618